MTFEFNLRSIEFSITDLYHDQYIIIHYSLKSLQCVDRNILYRYSSIQSFLNILFTRKIYSSFAFNPFEVIFEN
jgi:hypothetical protein